MNIEFQSSESALVVRPRIGRLDAVIAPEFRRQVSEHIAGHKLLVLCLDDVSFIDSSGLSAIVSLLKALTPGSRVRFVQPSAAIQALLRTTRLDRVFTCFPSVETAIAG